MPAKRAYAKVTDRQRAELLNLLQQNISIREASEQLGINYENAKVIYRVYRLENRTTKQIKRLMKNEKSYGPYGLPLLNGQNILNGERGL